MDQWIAPDLFVPIRFTKRSRYVRDQLIVTITPLLLVERTCCPHNQAQGYSQQLVDNWYTKSVNNLCFLLFILFYVM